MLYKSFNAMKEVLKIFVAELPTCVICQCLYVITRRIAQKKRRPIDDDVFDSVKICGNFISIGIYNKGSDKATFQKPIVIFYLSFI